MSTTKILAKITDILDEDCHDLPLSEYREVLEEIISDCESRLDASKNDKDEEE